MQKNNTQKILVTGATGNVAGLVLPQLKQKGCDVRVLLRSDKKSADFKSQGYDVVIGEYSNKDAIKQALTGVDSVFLVTPAGPDSHKHVENFLAVAKDFPQVKIVRLSAVKGHEQGPTPNTQLHGQSDTAIRASINPYVILQPHFFMQNLMMSGQSIAAEGKMYWGMGEGKLGLIDTRDIADCAVACLTSSQWDYGTYTLTGPSSISFSEMASSLTKVLGKEVSYVAVPSTQVEKSIKDMGMGDWFATTMKKYSEAYASNWGNFTNAIVKQMTGHDARSFETFAKEVFLPATKK